jgi:selenocysteine lyase/cysteine desulfurase
LNVRLGLEPIAPESMLGAMAAITLPIAADDATTDGLTRALADDERIEVPVVSFPARACRVPGQPPARALLRISAQRYNEASDYERLADALVRRGLAARVPTAPSGIVAA